MPRKVQRTKPITVRLTESEKLDWDLKAHAAGLSISELVRQAMNRVKIHHVGDRSIQIERTRQIAKIGNNLNQIARWVNRYKTGAMRKSWLAIANTQERSPSEENHSIIP